ncbi:MAG: hypothetical protein MI749_12215, partial [Desulfovibrionales bacterium]|nr:hypothetical protein [Desulfovibrionales bacterium]
MILTIPITHRIYTQGEKQLTLEARTLSQALEQLFYKFPDLKANVCDAEGKLLPEVEITINQRLLSPKELTPPLDLPL